jgi:hypothetical protein
MPLLPPATMTWSGFLLGVLLSFRKINNNKDGTAKRAITGAVTRATSRQGMAKMPARIIFNIVSLLLSLVFVLQFET